MGRNSLNNVWSIEKTHRTCDVSPLKVNCPSFLGSSNLTTNHDQSAEAWEYRKAYFGDTQGQISILPFENSMVNDANNQNL